MTTALSTTAPSAAVTRDLARLESTLDAVIPDRTGSNLLVATWNLRAFGGLTTTWAAGEKDSP